MPLYEYRCLNCGHEFEKLVRFSEADQGHTCPVCQSASSTRKVSTFASSGATSGAAVSSSGCSGGGGRFT